MPYRPVVFEFFRALTRRHTYALHNPYLLFGVLWGGAFPLALLCIHLWSQHTGDPGAAWAMVADLTSTRLLAVFPLGLGIVFGALGTVRHEKDRAVHHHIARLQDVVRERTEDLRASHLDTVLALAQAIEAKHPYTRGHSFRVWEYARCAAINLNISADQMEELRFACYLHDVGKIKIPGRILNKTEQLTAQERRIMEMHPIYGERIVSPVRRFAGVTRLIRHHHERCDGSGYPDRLTGDQLTLLERIVMVADAMDAMRSTRSYRPAMDLVSAVEELKRCSGFAFDAALVPGNRKDACAHFDPDVTSALLTGLAQHPPFPVTAEALQEEDRLIMEYLAG